MSFPWLNPARLFAARRPRRPSAHAPRPRTRLKVEQLEDRYVPANFSLVGTTLYIYGTAANDTFTFSESTAYSGGVLTTTYNFMMDDQSLSYTNFQISQVFVFGLGGNDTGYVFLNDNFTIPGNPTPQTLPYTAILSQGGGLLLNSYGQQFLAFDGFANTYAIVNPGDSAELYTVPGSNNSTFVSSGLQSWITGGGEFHYVTGSSLVQAFANNPATDVAYHYDTPGQDTFVASSDAYSFMSGNVGGQSFFNGAIGFRFNTAVSTNGGNDIAYFYDSPGNDVFTGYSAYSSLAGTDQSGNRYADQAIGFGHTYAYSLNGGTDFAFVYNATTNTIIGNWIIEAFPSSPTTPPRNLP